MPTSSAHISFSVLCTFPPSRSIVGFIQSYPVSFVPPLEAGLPGTFQNRPPDPRVRGSPGSSSDARFHLCRNSWASATRLDVPRGEASPPSRSGNLVLRKLGARLVCSPVLCPAESGAQAQLDASLELPGSVEPWPPKDTRASRQLWLCPLSRSREHRSRWEGGCRSADLKIWRLSWVFQAAPV